MTRFFDLYEEWLGRVNCAHSPDLFRHWASREYCPGACRGWLEAGGDFPNDRALAACQPRTFHLRAHNASICPWRFRPGTLQGVHIRYQVIGADGATLFQERAGLIDAVVPPGGAIDLLVGIPPLPVGPYVLHVDLIDVDQNAFCQFDQDPFVWEFRVVP